MTSLRNNAASVVEPFVELPSCNSFAQPSAIVTCTALLWRQRKWLLKATAVGGVITLLISLMVPNRYESSTRLMSPDMRGSASEALMTGLLSRTGGGLAGLSANLLGLDNTGAVFIGVLRSRSLADKLVSRFDLKKVYHDRRDQDAREDLADNSEISDDRKSGIITISVEDRDPRRAAEIAGAYVDELNHLLANVNTSSAHRERVFIEERLQIVKAALDSASQQLADFSTKNVTIDPKEQGKAMVGAAVTIQGELIAAETQLHGLQPIYSDSNIRIHSLKARIAELRHQLQELRGNDADATPGSGDNAYPSFRQLPALGTTYADLYREMKLREVVFETLTQQYEMAKIAEAKEIPSVKVLDPANLPEKKSGPHRFVITLLGLVVSFAFGAVVLIGRETWRLMDPEDPRRALAVEVLQETHAAHRAIKRQAQKLRAKLETNSNSNGNSDLHSRENQ